MRHLSAEMTSPEASLSGRARMAARLVALAVAIGTTGCGALPGVTGDEDSTAAPEAAPAGGEDAEAAARGLVRSWQDGDRETASRFGTDEALNALFGTPAPPKGLTFVHCLEGDLPVARSCLFESDGLSLSLSMRQTPDEEWAAVGARFVP